ncbi:MAG: hypothetical protein ABIM89_09615 [Mycobacteriales bacterium]
MTRQGSGMAWGWEYELVAGPARTGGFPTQAEAEAWVSDSWQQLYADGARAVTLMEGDREVYRMSLESG